MFGRRRGIEDPGPNEPGWFGSMAEDVPLGPGTFWAGEARPRGAQPRPLRGGPGQALAPGSRAVLPAAAVSVC